MTVVVSRMLIGLASGARSAAQSYITTKSAPGRRTENLALAQAVNRVGQFVGPVVRRARPVRAESFSSWRFLVKDHPD